MRHPRWLSDTRIEWARSRFDSGGRISLSVRRPGVAITNGELLYLQRVILWRLSVWRLWISIELIIRFHLKSRLTGSRSSRPVVSWIIIIIRLIHNQGEQIPSHVFSSDSSSFTFSTGWFANIINPVVVKSISVCSCGVLLTFKLF